MHKGPSPLPPASSRLGKKIRKARLRAGLSQLALAHAIGRSGEDAGADICRVEKGLKQVSLDTLLRLGKVLKVSVSELL